MNTEIRIAFLRSKISTLGTALFYDQSDQVLPCPTSLIQTFDMDAQGNMYFFIERPYIDINGMDRQFAGQLHFYKKGVPWNIDLCGTASIAYSAETPPNKILIRFRIVQAKCFHTPEHYSSVIAKLGQRISNFIRRFYRDVPDCLEIALE